ncbi:hypothetical protein ES319_D05G415400v1 [Gossypium barbadense]|uniref:Sulfotransferase n=1 Tax=Gossypium barbadense TaxID=3634 RepID=A0A5J5RNN0_GOSBA|nr:hypothetical protein ES319_D05G415400v1 [Gossypium barbadense]
MESHLEKQDRDVLQKSFEEMISTLPKVNFWGLPLDLYQYQGFWITLSFLQGALSAQQQFQAQPTDIILCSSLRTGYSKSQNTQPIQLDEAFELFYEGVSMYGSYWDHVLGYWKASLEHPDKLMFLKYEDLVENTVLYLKKIAEFIGYPFSSEEQQEGVPENIVQMCSFENLSGLEVNKTGKHREGQGNLEVENNVFFRKGKVGDWKNYLTTEMSQRLDQRTLQKLSSSGLSL